MDYSSTYFDKPLQNLGYQDITDYFVDAKEESTRIEFKAFSAQYGNFNNNLDGVIRGICAFLNSEGGILIWGAPEGVPASGQTSKIFRGQLSPLTELKEKDWLINKISDSITPLPVGINVAILQNGTQIVYVFEVQPSNYSPHQYKNTYLARLDGQTKPAPHYLIEALFKKIRYPNIEGFVKLDSVSHDSKNYILNISILIFNFSPLQNEENVSYRLMCPQGLFYHSKYPSKEHMYLYEGHQLIHKDLIDVLHFGAPDIYSDKLIFNPLELSSKYNNEVDFLLSFGGKYSPLKASRYKLDFGKVNWNKKKDPNYLFSAINENELVVDKQKDLGITREETLKQILGR